MEIIGNYTEPLILIACYLIGFALKSLRFIPNRFIPSILMIIGVVLGFFFVEQQNVLYSCVVGAISGFASTGFNELIRGTKKEESLEDVFSDYFEDDYLIDSDEEQVDE